MEDILRCPVTKLGLKGMTDEELNHLNRRILSHELRHLDGTSVQRPLTQAFVSEDGRFAYIVEDEHYYAAFGVRHRVDSGSRTTIAVNINCAKKSSG